MAAGIQADSEDELGLHSYAESSQDELALSWTGPRPKTTRSTAKPSLRNALRAGSPNKQTPNKQQTVEATFSSPSKTMVLNTGKAGGASPWNIKITVEAEPGSDEENDGSPTPSRGRTTRARTTRTTTVPLKDPDASHVRRRGPVRAKKTVDSSPTKAKRNATPVRKKSRSRKSTIGVADLSIADISAGNVAESLKKRPGRPRKSVQPEVDIFTADNIDVNAPDETQEEDFVDIRHLQPGKTQKIPVRFSSSELGTPESSQDQRPTQRFIRPGTPVRLGSRPEGSSLLTQPKNKNSSSTAPKSVKSRKPTPVRQAGSQSGYKPTTASESESQEQITTASKGGSIYTVMSTTNTGSETGSEYKPTSASGTGSMSKPVSAYETGSDHKPTSASESGSRYQPTSISSDSDHQDTPSGSDDGKDAKAWRNMVPQISRGASEALPIEVETEVESEGTDDVDMDDDQDVDAEYNFENVDRTLGGFDINTTIMESENFTMISYDALPSYQAMSSPAMEEVGKTNVEVPSGIVGRLSQLKSDRNIYEHPSQISIPYISSTGLTPSYVKSSSPFARPRERTPVNTTKSPSVPPAIEVTHVSPKRTPTPKLARVVKAGIALQGLVDFIREPSPDRLSVDSAASKKRRLDTLFSGFGEGTRRELRAGLRLGEKIARMSQDQEQRPSPSPASTSEAHQAKIAEEAVFKSSGLKPTQRLNPRLPTPDERDQYSLFVPPTTASPEVQYPDLTARAEQTHLASPARSVDEMNWRVDTPLAARPYDPEGQRLHQYLDSQATTSHEREAAAVEDDEANEEDQSNIWEEEACRSSDLPTLPKTRGSQQKNLEYPDLLLADGDVLPPARGKIPRTWRRKISSGFQYSDEIDAEMEEVAAPTMPHPGQRPATQSYKGKEKAREPLPVVEYDEQEESEGGDDTGMFWKQNRPTVYTKKRSLMAEVSKLDLTDLLGGDSSPAKDSSVVASRRSTPAQKISPKVAQLQPTQPTPYKSSPLKQQLLPGDLASERSFQSSFANSRNERTSTTLDGGNSSTNSDIRQLRSEMEARAYEPHNSTLHEIEEATEHSHLTSKVSYPSSPPEIIDNHVFERRFLAPKRACSPLFQDSTTQAPARKNVKITPPKSRVSARESSASVPAEPAKAQSGLFSRLTSTLWSTVTPVGAPPTHPTTLKLSPLPRVEPWTKTHYKTLDTLFQIHKRRPKIFAPASPPNTNNAILESIPNRKKFIGAVYSNWGYEVTITEQYLVMAAVFMQLLTLTDIEEYGRTTGKDIDRGDVGPGPAGELIELGGVVSRLFTVIAGEALRRDEKLGIPIRREGGLSVKWGC